MSVTVAVNPEIDSTLSEVPEVHYDINGTRVDYRTYPATSWSSSGINFSIIPPSMDVRVNRAIAISYPFTVTYTGTTTGTYLLDDGYDSLRSLPGLRILQNQSISINGTSVPVSSVYDTYVDILQHYNEDYRKKHPLGAIDVTQNYEDSIGAINNPLSNYSNNESFSPVGVKRGSYPIRSITRTATSATITYDVIEWLYVSGLFGCDCAEEPGLTRVRELNINMNVNFDPKYLISHANGGASTITSCNVVLAGQPFAFCKFITVPRELIPSNKLTYPHLRMERFVSQLRSTLLPLATDIIMSNNVQLSFVPKYCWAFVREEDNSMTYNSTNTFTSIEKVEIQFNNQSSILGSANSQQLWEMSVNNGLLDSYNAWNGTTTTSGFAQVGSVGAIACFEFGRHISLGDPTLSIGSSGTFNFDMKVTLKNINRTTTMNNPTLYIIIGYNEDLNINERGDVDFTSPVVPLGEVASGNIVKIPYNTSGLEGMSKGGSAKSFFKGVGKFLKESKILSNVVAPVATSLLPPGAKQVVAPILDQTLKSLGVGGSNIISGGRAMGGAVLSQPSIKKAIRML